MDQACEAEVHPKLFEFIEREKTGLSASPVFNQNRCAPCRRGPASSCRPFARF